ncbi:MAG: heparinase II/III family protein [Clostridia bacterium]|nr:heparinase II/III family protein [Clostridia bacterium]
MRKTFALMLLCLALIVVSLASCSLSGGGDGTDAPETTPETTAIPEHDHVWDEGRVVKEGTCDSVTKEETKGEIMFTCTICGETKTEETDGHIWNDGKVIDAATCKQTGSCLRTCTKCGTKKTFEIPKTDDHKYVASGRYVTAPTVDRDGEAELVCSVCGKASTQPASFADYQTKVNQVKAKLSNFSNTDFGGTSSSLNVTSNLGSTYTAPTVKPTKGQHPRVMFNENDIAGINRALNNGMNEAAAKEFRRQVALMETGSLPAAYDHGGTNGTHNFNGQVLSNIMALALDYRLSGSKISGYQAILAAKNYLKTIDVQSFKPDPERTMGNIMYAMACVYDWCYDLMTKTDKDQIVAGVQHKCCESVHMEVGFPPSGQGSIAGHGCEFQILRDYLSFAIAIYDEYPGWWNYVGYRFYNEYVPARNEFYRAGMVPQGVSQYVQIRFASDCYAALLIKAMSGSLPFDEEGMHRVILSIHSYELPNEYTFASGDGSNTTSVNQIKKVMEFGMASMITSHLFGDATVRSQFEYGKYSYSIFGDGQYGLEQTVGYACEELICSSGEVKATKDRHVGMSLIVYNGGWLGQTIARNNWGANQAAVLMKIGVRADTNHGHQDAGQFQIWYKAMLAGDTGAYSSYNTDHWRYYHQATIAHNSLLINNGGGGTYYCGGQISHTQETGSLTGWTNGSYETGVVTAHEEGYLDAAKTKVKYAYIAGDIAKAYGSSTATTVDRRMLAVYETGNNNVPMFFFVFDDITAASANYRKTFLLHTISEPTVSGKTVTVTSSQGSKLVLQNLLGGDNITKVGGTGSNYKVNGTQLTPNRYELDGYWGRVEISTNTGSATSYFLNAMYVCDTNKDPGLTATAISGSAVKGARIGNVAAVFISSPTRRTSAFTFNAEGTGDLTYYVSGVAAGNWSVSAGGSTRTVTATADGGLLVFTAPAGGTVTITPVN